MIEDNTKTVVKVRTALQSMQALHNCIQEALVGQRVRVGSDHNGQPYWRSGKSWKGEERRIVGVFVQMPGEIQLQLEGHEHETYIPFDEVELI